MTALTRTLIRRSLLFVAMIGGGTGGFACSFQKPAVKSINIQNQPVSVRSSVKAHLLDGSTVIFPNGVTQSGGRILGAGKLYTIGVANSVAVASIRLDSIVGMEAYDAKVNIPASVAATTGVIVVGAAGTIAILKAIFGSCPTFYSDSAGVELLQGEGFSYSVAPLLEQRDVDKLRVEPTPDGRLALTVRNEALETHYINHIGILETLHSRNETVFPDQGGRPVALSNLVAPLSIRDRAGRDIASIVSAPDASVFATDPATFDKASEADLDDWIDIDIPAESGADTVAVVLNMRNSLLNTVLLYDYILGAPGLRSLDFLGKDLENISGALGMAKWYTSHMGMRISVLDNGKWRQVARIGDSGPIAYHKLAVMVPAIRTGTNAVKVRLAFVADDWRIDQVQTSSVWRRPTTRAIAPSRVAMFDPAQNAAALSSIAEPDEGYLITSPGSSFRVEFEAGEQTSEARTFSLASQGYYTEWVRGSWIKHASREAFVPSSATLLRAMRSWRGKQQEMERQFFSSRIATR